MTAVISKRSTQGFSIRQRLTLIVVLVAVPMLALSAGIAWRFAEHERETSRQALTYSARSIMSAVDAELGKYAAVAQALAGSPTLQRRDLVEFRREALRAIVGLPGTWVTLVDPSGQQLINTLIETDESLPPMPAAVHADEERGFATGEVQYSNVFLGPVAKIQVTGPGVPVVRDGKPAYYLLIGVQADTFRDLLNSRQLPEGWMSAIVDRAGNYVARSLDHDKLVGKSVANGWRAVMGKDGVFDYVPVDGKPVIHANSTSALTGWAVGVTAERSVLEAPIRDTTTFATLAALAVTFSSMMAAVWAARAITSPLEILEDAAGVLQRGERVAAQATGVPEVDRALSAFDAVSKELIARETALTDAEHRMRLAQDAAHAGSWEWMLTDNRNYWSESLWALFGMTIAAREPSRQAWAASIHPDDRERVTAAFETAAVLKHEFEVQWRVAVAKGEPERWLLARGRPIAAPDGTVERYMGIVIDVTERMRAEQALRENERRIAAILEALPIGVALVDEHGRTLVGNTFYRRFVPGLIPSRDSSQFGHWEAYDDQGSRIEMSDFPAARALRGEPVWPGQEFLYRGDEIQGPLWTRVAALPFFDAHSVVTGAVVVISHIDEEKRAQEERRTLQSELLHVSRLSEMGQMAAALAHELNQPLTAVAVYVGGCQRIVAADQIDDALKQKLQRLMQMITDQALRAGEVIRQLRDFVHKGAGERRVRSAAGVIREATVLAVTAAKHKGVSVKTEIDPAGLVSVNKVQIQQVVFNLVRNAIEAMETSPRKELSISLRVKDGNAVTSIADTGVGIAPEIMDRLFLPFSSTKREGMGIGLSVCRNIVEAHQGRIWAEAASGGGTVFRFALPLVEAETADEAA